MLEIPNVTLCCAFTLAHELHLMAVNDCLEYIKFGDVKIFSDPEIYPNTIKIGPFTDGTAFGEFVLNDIPYKIKTSHVLFIQWDSWVIDPDMWNDKFLQYDYIGAPWWYKDNLNVGNNGFCLRSVALMRYLAENRDRFPIGQSEDQMLCREQQKHLPQFKWAPEKLASEFSFERSRPSLESRHFGFHGMFNWPFVLPPDKLAERMTLVCKSPYIKKTGMLNELDNIFGAHWLKLRS